MATFSDVMRGTRARKVVQFPLPNRRSRLLDVVPIDARLDPAARAVQPGQAPPDSSEPPLLVDLVVLTGDEEALALTRARAFAQARGVAEPKQGEPIYDLALMVYTLIAGVLDHDSTDAAPRPFFETAEQVLANLDRDRIVYLYALHEAWVDEVSPQARELTTEGFLRWVVALAKSEGPEDPPFADLRSGTLWSYMRTLAGLYLNLLPLSSPDTPGSDGSTSDGTSKPSEPVH